MTWIGTGRGRRGWFVGTAATLAVAGALLAPTAGAQADAPAADCQPFLDDGPCLQPFPNDLFTTKANTPTGRRVAVPAEAMPVNEVGVPIDPSEWNRNDGFSPGSMIASFLARSLTRPPRAGLR